MSKKILVLAAMLFSLASCSNPPETPGIVHLRQSAKAHGDLNWEVVCVAGHDWSARAFEGHFRSEWWYVWSDTPDAAAESLAERIDAGLPSKPDITDDSMHLCKEKGWSR